MSVSFYPTDPLGSAGMPPTYMFLNVSFNKNHFVPKYRSLFIIIFSDTVLQNSFNKTVQQIRIY